MIEEKFSEIFINPSELCPNIKKIKMSKLKEKYLYKEMQGKMITDIEMNNFNNIPLSRSNLNNIEISIPVKVVYKIYKPGDIIMGEYLLYQMILSVKLLMLMTFKQKTLMWC